jgi:hypothetical protein
MSKNGTALSSEILCMSMSRCCRALARCTKSALTHIKSAAFYANPYPNRGSGCAASRDPILRALSFAMCSRRRSGDCAFARMRAVTLRATRKSQLRLGSSMSGKANRTGELRESGRRTLVHVQDTRQEVTGADSEAHLKSDLPAGGLS